MKPVTGPGEALKIAIPAEGLHDPTAPFECMNQVECCETLSP